MSGKEPRRTAFWVTLCVLMALAVESASWAFFRFYGEERLHYHIKVDERLFAEEVLNAPAAKLPGPTFHRVMGWDEIPVNSNLPEPFALASRNEPSSPGKTGVSVYGDSFTYCQDVADDETWPHYLGELSATGVANFGARGYGPDQALLKLELDLNAGRHAKIVILSALSENIARIVNVNPRFYWAEGSAYGFKPVLVEENGVFSWKGDYLENLSTPEGRASALDAVEKYDFWRDYNRRRPTIGFPYSVSLIQTSKYLLFDVKRWEDLWKEERPVKTMRAVVDRFVALGKENGFTPVLLFIPEIADLKRYQRNGKMSYAEFAGSLKTAYGQSGLVVVDIAEERFDPASFNITPYSGHASAYGNKIIAGAVFRKIGPFLRQPAR
ncbi:MAG: hypothetical protein HY751_02370 [Nitrospinae bacterium]|nr:hypothetical protein [Nitrospinota bacterium]